MSKIYFDRKEQHFAISDESVEIPDRPLTVTLQIMRRCNLQCVYCSESEYVPDPTLDDIKKMIHNLEGVKRIIVAGGEPTLRKDLFSILKICKDSFEIVAMASNAVNITPSIANKLKDYIDYIDVTIDGPRGVNDVFREIISLL